MSAIRTGGGVISRREPCKKCGMPVFLAERLNVDNHLYHRTCFRCARCSHQLNLANYYETEDGQYCCEICPDEDRSSTTTTQQLHSIHSQSTTASMLIDKMAKMKLVRSLSDDEKELGKNDTKIVQARNTFIISQLNDSSTDDYDQCDGIPPELPKTEPPDIELTRTDSSDIIIKTSEQELSFDLSKSNLKNETEDNMTYDSSNLSTSIIEAINIEEEDDDVITTETVNTEAINVELISEAKATDDDNSLKDNIVVGAQNVNISDNNYNNVSSSLTDEIVTKEDETEEVNTKDDNLQLEVRSLYSSNSDEQTQFCNSDTKNIQNKGTTSDSKLTHRIEDYPEDLNPFEDDNVEESIKNEECIKEEIPIKRNSAKYRENTNPFESDDESEDTENPVPLIDVTPVKMTRVHPIIVSTNPFGSDTETTDEEEIIKKPIPKPRSINPEILKTPEPTPRTIKSSASRSLNSDGFRGSSTSLESTMSGKSTQTPTGTYRKKKPAPPPPSVKDVLFPSLQSPHSISSSSPSNTTPTHRARKSRPAPAPPSSTAMTATPLATIKSQTLTDGILTSATTSTDLGGGVTISVTVSPTKSLNSSSSCEIEKEKNNKDAKNRNRQSLTASIHSSSKTASTPSLDDDNYSYNLLPLNKSTHGKWKRKKGPAPQPRPLPQRRQINSLSLDEVNRQLDVIEIQQQGLEKQGVKLEQIIREKCEIPGVEEDVTNISPEVEDLVLQLFELVNEKNELFRKQAELMYLRRQQRLEEEHADLEYQIRCLMERPENNKTDFDKAREEELIARLIEVVETRNEIVECLEMDRIREAEEDESIQTHMHRFTLTRANEGDTSLASIESTTPVKLSKKEKKKQKKIKKSKDGITIDADKDVDETELALAQDNKKKKKWLFHI